jgi:hypothetical protein
MLEARYRIEPKLVDHLSQPYWQAYCGQPDCGGVLAVFEPGWERMASIAAGFIEVGPLAYRLSRHAAKNRHHAPRRVRATSVASGTGKRLANGALVVDGPNGWRIGIVPQTLGQRATSMARLIGPLAPDDVLTVWCPDHAHLNIVRVVEVERRKTATRAQG